MNEVEKKEVEETLLNSFNKDDMELSFNGEVVNDHKMLKVLDDIVRQALVPYFADVLYNAGYRKLPEDSVVLSREEQEYIQSITEKRIKELKKQITQARKETAEKIFKEIKEIIDNVECIVDNYYSSWNPDVGYDKKQVDKGIYEIAKQFGVEIKE